ncbi:MAG: GAF domain-containing sensor histidine kinase [Candidatus Dormibacteraeota bacterium]|nr:GAF domain-containing sensor histidine kinase [Candidatus Dormibacteraeota bacterium]
MAVRSPRSDDSSQDFGELIQIALDVAGSLDPGDVIARILERGTHAVQADRATLSSLVGDHVVIEATYGRAGELTWVGQRYSLDYFEGQPLVQKAIDTLLPAFGGRLAADRAAPEFREALTSVRHVAVVPLVHGGQAIGMLVFSRYEDRAFTSDDLATLTLLGTISGLALRNARLFEEGQAARNRADETAARLRQAVEAAEDVAGQVQLDEVLRRLLQRAGASVDADGTSLARLEGAEMVIESTPTGSLVGTRWPLMPKVLAGVLRGRAVELTAAEYTGAPEGLESVVQPYRRFLVAPLAVGGETIGLLAMGRKTDEPFDPVAVQSLQHFSTLGALLLRNARLIAQAQVAEQAKSEFMSIAVHELRAPLTVVSGYLGMALEGAFGDLPPALKDVLATAQRKTAEAKVLADELLTVARLEGRVLTPKAEPLSVVEALQEAVARARPRAGLVQATITIESADDSTMMADRAMVGKILDNLLNNALTYTDRAPTIRLQARRDAGQLAIRVTDDGPGVAAADQTRIFERFARGSDQLAKEKPGSGLGLYLSRGLAEQMGGSLQLQASQPGKGSTFVLRLPLTTS